MLGKELRRARIGAGLTQEEVAARSGITREYVSHLEAGKYTPTVEVFIRVSRAVGLRPAELIAAIEAELFPRTK